MAGTDKSKSLRCVVVTPEKTVLDCRAAFVAFPAIDGELGVAPSRAPLVARLGSGKLKITPVDKEAAPADLFLDGGFAQVSHNVVTLLTERAFALTAINKDTIAKGLEEWQAKVPTTDEAFNEKFRKLESLRAQRHLLDLAGIAVDAANPATK